MPSIETVCLCITSLATLVPLCKQLVPFLFIIFYYFFIVPNDHKLCDLKLNCASYYHGFKSVLHFWITEYLIRLVYVTVSLYSTLFDHIVESGGYIIINLASIKRKYAWSIFITENHRLLSLL